MDSALLEMLRQFKAAMLMFMNPFSINFLLGFLINLKFSRLNDVLPKCFVIGFALAGALLVLFGGACMCGCVLGFFDGPGFC